MFSRRTGILSPGSTPFPPGFVVGPRNGRVQTDLCGLRKTATLPDRARSLNLNATAGAANDIYKHNPWRAPGSAPVADACGLAGGTPWLPEVGNAGDYTRTKFAHHGTNGSTLPPLPTGVEWRLGGLAEVTHGDGKPRLAPGFSRLMLHCYL